MEKKSTLEIPSTPFAFIRFGIKPYKKWFFWTVAFVLISELLGGLQSYALRGFVDAANSNLPSHEVFLWVLAYPVIQLFNLMAIRGTGFMMNYWTVHARTRAVKKLFEYLSLHSQSYFNDRFAGALSEKVNTVSQSVSSLAYQFIWSILSPFFTFIVTGSLLFSANRTLGFIFVIGFLTLIPINLWLTRKQIYLSERLAELNSKLRGYVIDVMTNITAVQQYARRSYEIERLDKSIIEYREADVKSDNYREKILVINNILVIFFVGGVILWAFTLWTKEALTVGELVMVIALTRSFMKDLVWIGQSMNNLMERYGEITNGLKEIIRPHEITDKPNAQKLSVENGAVSEPFLKYGYDVTLLDKDGDARSKAEENFKQIRADGFDVVDGLIEDFKFDQAYDAIILSNVLPFQKDKASIERIVKDSFKGLNKGGFLYFTLFGTQDQWASESADTMTFYTKEEALKIIEEKPYFVSEDFGQGSTMKGDMKTWHIFHLLYIK